MQETILSDHTSQAFVSSPLQLTSKLSNCQQGQSKLRTVTHGDWDQLVAEFDDVSFEQTAAFASERWGAHRIVCVTIERSGKIFAGACVVLFQLPGLRRGVAYVKYGPVWRRRGNEVCYQDYHSVMTQLIRKFGHEQGHALVVVPRPCLQTQTCEYDVLHEMGFEPGRKVRDPNRYLVDLSLSSEDQHKSLGQKWRYNLKRSLANDLEIDWSNDDKSISDFIELYTQMISRKNIDSTDPMDALRGMKSSLPYSLRPQVVLAYHSGRPIAGAVVMTCGDTAYYVFGASRDEALPLRAGYAVQWSIVERLKKQGAKWYDLGGEVGASGLRQFKNGLVGKHGVILNTHGEVQYCSGVASQVAGTLVMGASKITRMLRTSRLSGRIAK